MEKEVLKIIKDLFKPVDESLEYLQRIDKKLDLQASSKLRGQFEMLELLTISKKKKQAPYEICLGNLHESIEYYKGLTDQTIKEHVNTYANHRVKYLLVNTPKAWVKFGRKAWQKEVLRFAKILNYASLWCLSEAAAIFCLVKLNYSSQIIEEHEHQLANSFVSVFKFIVSKQAIEFLVLADAAESGGLKARIYEYMSGKNELRSVIKGFHNYMAIEPLIPDRLIDVELKNKNDTAHPLCIANKAFECDRKKRWRSLLDASK